MRPFAVIPAVLSLAACGVDPSAPEPERATPRPALPPRSAQPAHIPAVPAGSPKTVPAVAASEMQEAASVSQLHALPRYNAKVFSVSGGDPAVNGLVTYLGLFHSSAEGWRLYPIGDYAEWRVTDSAPGRIAIQYRQDTAGPADDIVTREGRAIIAWTQAGQGTPPPSVTVTPAR